ncbi:MAG TPA: DUF2087 domain-containing protein [Acidimicrobiales bacterium]|nr:DUF2087 domain-containing protein [Acidimicrobiales bacterium]
MPADEPPLLDAAALVGLLADDGRRRAVAALVLGHATLAEVRAATGLDTRGAVTALDRLVDAELVVRDDEGRHWLVDEAFRIAARAAAPAAPPDEHPDAPPDAARVLRAFVRDGRLTAIPMSRAKRLVLLDLLAQEFVPGERYAEREVNRRLRRWHDDVAALRRYLVDEGFLAREAGEYWRSGGSVPTA